MLLRRRSLIGKRRLRNHAAGKLARHRMPRQTAAAPHTSASRPDRKFRRHRAGSVHSAAPADRPLQVPATPAVAASPVVMSLRREKIHRRSSSASATRPVIIARMRLLNPRHGNHGNMHHEKHHQHTGDKEVQRPRRLPSAQHIHRARKRGLETPATSPARSRSPAETARR